MVGCLIIFGKNTIYTTIPPSYPPPMGGRRIQGIRRFLLSTPLGAKYTLLFSFFLVNFFSQVVAVLEKYRELIGSGEVESIGVTNRNFKHLAINTLGAFLLPPTLSPT